MRKIPASILYLAALPLVGCAGNYTAPQAAAVTPVPETLSEYQFAGLLRGRRVELVDCRTVPLKVPAQAEIVLEGHVALDEFGEEGPYGDHTGYYNAVEPFPVFRLSAITMRRQPIYLSTFTGRPPDEPDEGLRLLLVGSQLVEPRAVAERNFDRIRDLARQYVQIVQQTRSATR